MCFKLRLDRLACRCFDHWNVSVSLLLNNLHTCRIDVTYVYCRNQTADLRFSDLVFARIVSDQQG